MIYSTFLAGCIYSDDDCPSPAGGFNTVTLATITLETAMPPYEVPLNKTKQGEAAVPDIRFIVCVFTQAGVLKDRQVITSGNINQTTYQVEAQFQLSAGKYRMVCWADYVIQGSSADWYYNTEDLTAIFTKEPYAGNTDWKRAFTAYKDIDLTNQQEAVVVEDMTLQIPFAQFRIIADDLAEYINDGGSAAADISVAVTYPGYLFSGYDAFNDTPTDQLTQGESFTGDARVLPDTGLLLGWDYVWADKQALTLHLNMIVYNEAKEVINTITHLAVPYKQGMLTTITGHFLTAEYDSGIGIITAYDGDINVPLP